MAVFSGFSNITKVPELRRRILFSLMIIAIYRIGVFISTPGVDRHVMKQVVSGQGGLVGLFNLFSGGALENLSIFALGIMPYISASIIMQLLAMVSKQVEELRKDRAPSKAVQVSDFGLIIITRKRVKSSLERQLTEPCPYCSGTGTIKASATICYDILNEVKKVSSELDGYSLVLRVNPEIARALKDEGRAVFRELEASVGRPVTIRTDDQLHHEQFDLMAI